MLTNVVFKCCDKELEHQGAGLPVSLFSCDKCDQFFIVLRRKDGKYEVTAKEREKSDVEWFGR